MKQNILKGIYAITPDSLDEETLYKKVHKLLEQGVNILQYRDKCRSPKQKIIIAKELRNICNKFDSLLIINDDAKLAKKVGANGVHLGQKDMPYEEARNILGPDSIIGISCQNDLGLALKAQSEGADYVAFGSLFSTKSKADVIHCSLEDLTYFVKEIKIPSVAIGGINLKNFITVKKSGVDMIAMSSGLFFEEEISELKLLLKF
tara:strand:+ start:221 stop:835 length:615 start_codon:yes stop_codon:yes gene_type:complete